MSQSRPQFPHQHIEVGELDAVSGPFQRHPLGILWSSAPRLESESWGHGRKKELSSGGRAELWVVPGSGPREGPPWSPHWKAILLH